MGGRGDTDPGKDVLDDLSEEETVIVSLRKSSRLKRSVHNGHLCNTGESEAIEEKTIYLKRGFVACARSAKDKK